MTVFRTLLSELDLHEFPENKKALKRAYARKLKSIDQAEDPAAFQRMREAYEKLGSHLQSANGYQPAPLPNALPQEERASPPPASTLNDSELGYTTEQILTLPESNSLEQESVGFDKPNREFVDEQLQLIRNLEGEPADLDEIQEILGLEEMTAPVIWRELEQTVFDYLARSLIHGETGRHYFKPYITDAFLDQLDLLFGWQSDFKTLALLRGDQGAVAQALHTNSYIRQLKQKFWWRRPENILSITLFAFCYSILILTLPDLWWKNNATQSLSKAGLLLLVPYTIFVYIQTLWPLCRWLLNQIKEQTLHHFKLQDLGRFKNRKTIIRLVLLCGMTIATVPDNWQRDHTILWLGTTALLLPFKSARYKASLKTFYEQN
ncbi:hypothetical protein PsAD37_04560 [Pseudovibrio sp. Ad37]|nr:hypothetical protein PsAD37_04560 [Pseudovibrio sp. Ad37]